MNILKKWWLWIIILVLLVIFFYPKSAGGGGGGELLPPDQEITYVTKYCSCFGLKFDETPTLMDVSHSYSCAGIPYACNCVKYTGKGNLLTKEEVKC
jgi:hypothetical protein